MSAQISEFDHLCSVVNAISADDRSKRIHDERLLADCEGGCCVDTQEFNGKEPGVSHLINGLDHHARRPKVGTGVMRDY